MTAIIFTWKTRNKICHNYTMRLLYRHYVLIVCYCHVFEAADRSAVSLRDNIIVRSTSSVQTAERSFYPNVSDHPPATRFTYCFVITLYTCRSMVELRVFLRRNAQNRIDAEIVKTHLTFRKTFQAFSTIQKLTIKFKRWLNNNNSTICMLQEYDTYLVL